jgi:hypothetical protein
MAKLGHDGHDRQHITETPDVSHIKNIDVTHEISDVSVSGVLKFVVALSLLTAFVFVLMIGLFRFFSREAQKQEPPPGPMAMTEQERLPPAPRLQGAPGFGVKVQSGNFVNLQLSEPQAEYRVVRQQWELQLKCQDGSSPGPSRPCVPIDEAMRKLLEGQGLRSRATSDFEGSALMLPTAASSGRVTEKRTQ